MHVAVLTAYFDDSGTHPQSPVALVAGWISPVPQWKKLIRKWEKAKTDFGFDTLHMSELIANNPKSEFADKKYWNEARKEKLLKRLREIIGDHAGQGFENSVSKKDYDDLVQGENRRNMGNFRYTYAVEACLGQVEKWRAGKNISEPTEHIFDRMAKGSAKEEIERTFRDAENSDHSLHRYGIYKGCHSFRDRSDVIPLQAADMLAWCAFRHDRLRMSGEEYPSQATVDTWNYFVNHGLIARFQTRSVGSFRRQRSETQDSDKVMACPATVKLESQNVLD